MQETSAAESEVISRMDEATSSRQSRWKRDDLVTCDQGCHSSHATYKCRHKDINVDEVDITLHGRRRHHTTGSPSHGSFRMSRVSPQRHHVFSRMLVCKPVAHGTKRSPRWWRWQVLTRKTEEEGRLKMKTEEEDRRLKVWRWWQDVSRVGPRFS